MAKPADLNQEFRRRVRAFRRELPHVEQGEPDALHRLRIASRRLRELLPLMACDADTSKKLGRRLRYVTRQLGTVREMDVLAILIEDLERDGRYSPAALQRLRVEVDAARVDARRQAVDKLSHTKLDRLGVRLRRVARAGKEQRTRVDRGGQSKRAQRWALQARQVRRASEVQAAIEAAGTLYSAGRLHALRVAIKKLRYAAELSKPAEGRASTTSLAHLRSSQDLLGRLHDLEVLVAWARGVQSALSPPNLSHWRELGAIVGAIEEDCRHCHGEFMRVRGKLIAIVARLAGRRAASSSDRPAFAQR